MIAGHGQSGFDFKVFLATDGRGKRLSTYAKDQVVFSQGDRADAVFYIHEGTVKVSVVSPQGKEAVVAVQMPGEFFGEACLTGKPFRIANALALSDSKIMRLDKAEIIRALHDEPAFRHVFVAHVVERTARLEEEVLDQIFSTSEQRLARTLLRLANFAKEGGPDTVIAKVSQEMLAEMVGTTRSRINFFMNKFRRLGLIDYSGTLKVHSSLLRVVLNDRPHIKAEADGMPDGEGTNSRRSIVRNG